MVMLAEGKIILGANTEVLAITSSSRSPQVARTRRDSLHLPFFFLSSGASLPCSDVFDVICPSHVHPLDVIVSAIA